MNRGEPVRTGRASTGGALGRLKRVSCVVGPSFSGCALPTNQGDNTVINKLQYKRLVTTL